MNYKNIYEKFMNYCQNSKPKERLLQRNKEDFRLTEPYIYTEVHHITPKSLGGDSSNSNLVELLPEEHLIAHLIRFKAFNQREDMLAFRMTLNGFAKLKRVENSRNISSCLNKKIKKGFILLKQHSTSFRKLHGWQTEEGRKAIAQSRRGTTPAFDAITGEPHGSVPNNHPKILSGEWVHHTKGYCTYFDKQLNKKVRITVAEKNLEPERYESIVKPVLEKNGRWSGITDAEIIQWGVDESLKEGKLVPYLLLSKRRKNQGLPFITHITPNRFNGRGAKGYIEEVEKMTGYIYIRHFKFTKKTKKIKPLKVRRKTLSDAEILSYGVEESLKAQKFLHLKSLSKILRAQGLSFPSFVGRHRFNGRGCLGYKEEVLKKINLIN